MRPQNIVELAATRHENSDSASPDGGQKVPVAKATKPPEERQPVGLDPIDLLPLTNMPDGLPDGWLDSVKKTLVEAVTDLAHEPTRKAALARLLARDIEIARIELRFLQAKRNLTMDQYAAGRCSSRKLELMERAVKRAHRMLQDSIATLARLDAQNPYVRVAVDKAAVVIKSEE